ncbi:type II secretion system F family protein [Hyphomonas sp.]|uniref:type II secretion system F family protein n=1 Tax=Hyphomonas sp. TaxID=87 RepID=UPI003918DE42
MSDLLAHPFFPFALGALALLLAVPGIVAFVRGQQDAGDLERRLARRGGAAEPSSKRQESRIGRAMMGFADQAVPAHEAEVSAVRAKLAHAGFTGQSAVSRYFAARFICVVLPQIGLFFALPYLDGLPQYGPLVISVILVLAGLAAPGKFLDHRISERRIAGSAGFPDMMDLLVACVEAGLSLDAAVQRVGEELELRHPVIAGHLRTLSLELRAGKTRKMAWRAFAERMGIEEAGSLSTMLRQAEEMGTSLGQTLRVFSADMRQRRILRAEEKAMALPAQMTLPLILFVFPVLLGVLILPAVVMLGEVMG